MNSTPALTFKSKTFEIVDHNGQAWLTLSDIAAALYAKGGDQSDAPLQRGSQIATPIESRVRDLYRRHADEFTAGMTALVERVTAGGKQMVRIFSLRGAHLLAMFARTPVAKEFRAWVLDILDRQAGRSREELIESALGFGRWFMSVRDGRIILTPVADDAMVVASRDMAEMVKDPGAVSIRDLPAIIAAASERLVPWVRNNIPTARGIQ